MATNTKTSVPPTPIDLEETAELPQLSATGVPLVDPLSATDAWRPELPPRSEEHTSELQSLV